MKEKVESLLKEELEPFHLVVSDVYDTNEEGVKTRNIELDSDEMIDVEKITEVTKIINPIMDEHGLTDDIDVLDIHSKEKGEKENG